MDVQSWVTANKLQLNDKKPEALIMLPNRMSIHSPLLSVIHFGDADVPFVSSVKKRDVKKSDHIHPVLQTLHRLPVKHRIQYKIVTASVPFVVYPFSICPISFNRVLQRDPYDTHPIPEPLLSFV